MADTDLDICSRVLVELGDQPITSMAGARAGQVLARTHYEKTVKQLLGAYRWNFARRTTQLSREASAPTGSKWAASYTRPDGWLMTHAVLISGTVIAWEHGPGVVYCDAAEADEVFMEYSYRVDTNDFPEYFIAYLEAELAAKWAFPLTSQETLAAEAVRQARVAKVEARSADSQSSTARRMPVSRFMLKRVGQGGYRA